MAIASGRDAQQARASVHAAADEGRGRSTELPPKTEIFDRVEMEQAQRAIYEAIRMAMHSRVQAAIAEKGLARSGIIILDALLKMRQACCDPRLLKLKAVEERRPVRRSWIGWRRCCRS